MEREAFRKQRLFRFIGRLFEVGIAHRLATEIVA